MHTVNWAEVLSKRAECGDDPAQLEAALTQSGLVHQLLAIDPGQPGDTAQVASLRRATRAAGLLLGDRYGLALGVQIDLIR